MIPDASELTRRRLTAQTIIRLLAVLPALAAVGSLGVMCSVIALDIVSAFGVLRLWDVVPFLAFAVVLGLAAWGLVALSGRLSRLIVPASTRPRCPACGYTVEGLSDPVCPECSAALTAEFMGRPPSSDPGPRPPVYRAGDAMLFFTPTVRLLGGGLAVLFATLTAIFVSIWVTEMLDYGPGDPEAVGLLVMAAFFSLMFLLSGLVLLAGGRVARWLVPAAGRIDRARNAASTGAESPAASPTDAGATEGAVR